MAHFPNTPPDARQRLDMRGINPEQSYIAWLEAILDGSFPLTVEGLPKRPEGRPGKRPRALSPIPLAIVLP